LEGPNSIFEWFRSTGLRPFLDALTQNEERQKFEDKVIDGYAQAYPSQKDGKVLFPFKRLFVIAYKKDQH